MPLGDFLGALSGLADSSTTGALVSEGASNGGFLSDLLSGLSGSVAPALLNTGGALLLSGSQQAAADKASSRSLEAQKELSAANNQDALERLQMQLGASAAQAGANRATQEKIAGLNATQNAFGNQQRNALTGGANQAQALQFLAQLLSRI